MYVIPATKETLGNFRWDEKRLIEVAKSYMEENDLPTSQWGEVHDFDDSICIISDCNIPLEIEVATIIGLPKKINVEITDELNDGYYIVFNEDDLYERKLSPVGEMLQAKGILPKKQ